MKSTTTASLYSFSEARRMARGYGFDSKEEFVDYSCPGAYKLPKNPNDIWPNQWKGWDDFLGICYNYEDGRSVTRTLQLKTKEEYLSLMKNNNNSNNNLSSSPSNDNNKSESDVDIDRLPYRPDLYYKLEWNGWDDWLGC